MEEEHNCLGAGFEGEAWHMGCCGRFEILGCLDGHVLVAVSSWLGWVIGVAIGGSLSSLKNQTPNPLSMPFVV